MRGAITSFVLTLTICVLAICLAMATENQKSAGDETGTIMSLESAWNQAAVQHDPRAMSMLLADRFSYTDSAGSVMNKSQWLDLMKKETATFEQLGNSGIAVYLYADMALVTGRYRERVKLKRNSVVRSGRFIDVWIKQNGDWKCIGGQATLITP